MTEPIIIDKNVKTEDILYKPKWWRWDSWKFHAFIIFALILVSTSALSYLSVVYPVMFGMNTQIVYNSANIALNWTALAYAIYIYKIYDDTKQKAAAAMQESGIKPISIEEGLGELLSKVKKASDWLDKNQEGLEKMYALGKKVDIEQIVGSLQTMGNMVESMQEHGFSKERFEKLFILFEKVDLDGAIAMVDTWNKSQETARKMKEAESAMLATTTREVCRKHPNVLVNINTKRCELCDLETEHFRQSNAATLNANAERRIPPLQRKPE